MKILAFFRHLWLMLPQPGMSFFLMGLLSLTFTLVTPQIALSSPILEGDFSSVPIVAQIPTISFSQLPPEAKQTLVLIERGGPFPYPEKDGTVFSNRERLLPNQPRGYYREYTIPTPGRRDRGARRFVIGRQGEIYYTQDHYASFYRVQRK